MKFWSAAVSFCAVVVAGLATWSSPTVAMADPAPTTTTTSPGYDVEIEVDASQSPEMKDWTENTVVPVLKEWYPKIVAELVVDGYTPPSKFYIRYDPKYTGVAETGGTRVRCNPKWFAENEQGEGVGALLHEMVHVVQQPGHKVRGGKNNGKMPSWLLEGSCDYIRWFQYEPEKNRPHPRANDPRTKFDGSYRVTATFLQYVISKYDKNIVTEMNAANWNSKYNDDLWIQYTGKTVQELGDEWKATLSGYRPAATQP